MASWNEIARKPKPAGVRISIGMGGFEPPTF
jgi:hypothetical protein